MYYTEPIKTQHTWVVEKHETGTGRKLETFNLGSKVACWSFLQTINIYVDGKLCYSGE